MARQYEIGVIGAGNAAEGIVHGIVRNTILFADRIIASDPSEVRRDLFTKRFQVAVTSDNRSDPATAISQYERFINVDKVDAVFGTHALIQQGVTIRRLGLAVIDEQGF